MYTCTAPLQKQLLQIVKYLNSWKDFVKYTHMPLKNQKVMDPDPDLNLLQLKVKMHQKDLASMFLDIYYPGFQHSHLGKIGENRYTLTLEKKG